MEKDELTEAEYSGYHTLIDKRIITSVELDNNETIQLLGNYQHKELSKNRILSGILQLFSGKFLIFLSDTMNLFEISINQITKFPSYVWDKYKFNQGVMLSLHALKTNFGIDWIINEFAEQMSYRFEMTHHQARALLFKLVGITMDSTTRTHLFQLKKKITKYKPLIDNFEDIIMKPDSDETFVDDIGSGNFSLTKTSGSDNTHLLRGSLDDMIRLGYYTVKKDRSGKEKLVTPNSIVLLSCQVCDHQERIDLNEVEDLEVKQHHNQEMQMILELDTHILQ